MNKQKKKMLKATSSLFKSYLAKNSHLVGYLVVELIIGSLRILPKVVYIPHLHNQWGY